MHIKTAIVYHSYHHGNTLKLVNAIAEKHEVSLIDATKDTTSDKGRNRRCGEVL